MTKKQILLTFGNQNLNAGQIITLNFEKIYNVSGQQINSQNFQKQITVYAPLTVHLASGNSATQLNRLILCSNNPLTIFEKTNGAKTLLLT